MGILKHTDRVALWGVVLIATAIALGLAQPMPSAVEPLPPYVVLINPNSADAHSLQRLPGIGPILALRIVAYRQTQGPLMSLEDLLEIRGIGPKTLRKLSAWLTFDQ